MKREPVASVVANELYVRLVRRAGESLAFLKCRAAYRYYSEIAV